MSYQNEANFLQRHLMIFGSVLLNLRGFYNLRRLFIDKPSELRHLMVFIIYSTVTDRLLLCFCLDSEAVVIISSGEQPLLN